MKRGLKSSYDFVSKFHFRPSLGTAIGARPDLKSLFSNQWIMNGCAALMRTRGVSERVQACPAHFTDRRPPPPRHTTPRHVPASRSYRTAASPKVLWRWRSGLVLERISASSLLRPIRMNGYQSRLLISQRSPSSVVNKVFLSQQTIILTCSFKR